MMIVTFDRRKRCVRMWSVEGGEGKGVAPSFMLPIFHCIDFKREQCRVLFGGSALVHLCVPRDMYNYSSLFSAFQ